MAPADVNGPLPAIDWWGLLTDPDHLRDPYPSWRRIRELAPVHRDPITGIHFVLGHRAFSAMARAPEMGRDTRLWTNGWNTAENAVRDPVGHRLFREFQPQMTNANPPEHRRMRDVYEKSFRQGALARQRPRIESVCQQVLAGLPTNGPVDFMASFAHPFARQVALALFELPAELEARYAEWVAALSLIGNVIITAAQKSEALSALHAFKACLKDHLASQAHRAEDSFLGLALAAAADGTLDEEETLNNLVTLVAGGAATATLLGNGLLTLMQHPQSFAALRADPSRLRSALEEMLRYEPGSSLIIRVAIQDYPCGGCLIPAGSLAIGLVGSINRDPERFEAPDTFDIQRAPNPHLTFGGGAHVCIGAALVRLTAEVAFRALMDRFAVIEPAGEPDWWTHRSDQRGLSRLPVQLGTSMPPASA